MEKAHPVDGRGAIGVSRDTMRYVEDVAMSYMSLGQVMKGALIAGLVAGLCVAAFHFVLTEPIIEQAITIEEQQSESAGMHEEPVVTRDVQRLGLVIGYLLYGLIWSVMLGGVYVLVQRWLPPADAARRALLLGLCAYWSIGLLPFLKYPANPPGVGDPATIGERQALYLAMLALSIAGTVLAMAVGNQVARRRGATVGWLAGVGSLLLFSAALYAVLPGNPDPVPLPIDLVGTFRVLSLAGLTLFWMLLALLFGALLGRAAPGAKRIGGATA
jgi:predicted cobalt transporter CbtA